MSQQNPYGGPPQGPYGPGGPGQGQPGEPGGPQPGWPQQPPGYPGQDPVGGGYAFGPFAPGQPQPYPGQPPGYYGGGPGQPPPGAPTPPKRRSKLPLVIGAAVLALVLIGIGVAVAVSGGKQSDAGRVTSSQNPTAPPSPASAAKPSDAVLGYLQAVAGGDLTSALAYAAQPVGDDTLLTQQVFDVARRRAPLTSISVPVVDDPTATAVDATYALGGKLVSETFRVYKVGEVFKLEEVAAEVDLSSVRSVGLPMLVNGTKVSSDTVYALPGAYSFTTGRKYVTYGAKSTLTVTSPSQQVHSLAFAPAINASGRKAVVAAAKKSFQGCLKQHKLNPKNCPFALNNGGYQIKESTIRWRRIGGDPFHRAKITAAGTTAAVTITFKVALKASCTGHTNCTGDTAGTNSAYFDLTSDKLSATWAY